MDKPKILVVRKMSALEYYYNGNVQTLTVTGTGMTGNNTTTALFPIGLSNSNLAPLTIGQYNNIPLNAYVADLRMVNSVLYTSSFTPSSIPFLIGSVLLDSKMI